MRLVLLWFIDGTRIMQLADDHGTGVKTVYRYLHEGIDVLAACGPDLADVPQAAKEAGTWTGGDPHRPGRHTGPYGVDL
ncbi:hypothetical protein [Actinomadura sp. 6N118]|uniref:hypothetical protein n=1 Tax=Actinomadura sp. 6N118 TaxID=3375151 RepID=UPI0037B28C38